MEVEVAAAVAKGSCEGTSRRYLQHRGKKFRRIEQESSEQVEDQQILDEEDGDWVEWLSYSRYYEDYIKSQYGSCEDITSVPPMRYTKGPIPKNACYDHALQIFSVQVTEAKNGLKWPLHVYGWVATRDSVDCKRNILFNRTRDDCQILTQQDSYLLLTGPSRAVVLIDPVTFQIELKVKGKDESEDKLLSLKAFSCPILPTSNYQPHVIYRSCSGKYSTIEVAYAAFHRTVEATVSIQVINGAWPDHIGGLVVCNTTRIDDVDIVLLDSQNERMPITCDGAIKLSRRIVSVEEREQLKVDVVATCITNDNSDVVDGSVVFTHQKDGSSYDAIDLGFCTVEITVAWSLLSWE